MRVSLSPRISRFSFSIVHVSPYKAHLGWQLTNEFDAVIVDRFDLTLYARAVAGWSLLPDIVRRVVNWSTGPYQNEPASVETVCLTASAEVRLERIKEKPNRRRTVMTKASQDGVLGLVLEEASRLSIPIIDTSCTDVNEVIHLMALHLVSERQQV